MQKIKNLITFGLLLCSIGTYAEVQQFEPSLPQFYNSVAERKANNQFYYLGEAKFKNGVSIPFYGVTAENPADGDGERLIKKYEKCTAKNCDFDFKLDTTQAKQLKLIALPSIGLTLVPREWQEIQSNAGGNGTGYALIMSKDHQQAIELSDSALCVGCGLRPATLYFPNLLPQSIENEFGGYKDSKKRLTLVHPNQNMAYFSYQIPKLSYTTHGIAQYQDEEFFNFKEIHVTLNESQKSLATTILNFYKFTH